MKTKRFFQLMPFAVLLALVYTAQAQTTFTPNATALTNSPTDVVSGFPVFITDSAGTQVGLCLDPANCVFDPAIPGNTFSERIGFGAEAVYFAAGATVVLPAGNAFYEAKVAAAFSSLDGEPVVGANAPLTRVRFRMPVAPEAIGTYTITHPYGQIVTNVAAGQTRIDVSQVVPFGQSTNVGPFLAAVDPAPPAGFLGNPGIASTVTGGPGGNILSIQGPGGLNAQTDQFFVMGQELGTAAPLTASPATAALISGQTARISVAGGLGGVMAVSSNPNIATVVVSGKTATIRGVAAGTTTVVVSDSSEPRQTATVSVEVTAAAAVVGNVPGHELKEIPEADEVSLVLNIGNTQGVAISDIVQEWIVVFIQSGSVGRLFFHTGSELVPLEQAITPTAVTFHGFDHTLGSHFIGAGNLGAAGFAPGDLLLYGYAFSTTPVTDFLTAPNLLLDNIVEIHVR